mmetsp:Transcript_30929/g.87600  ORF Transcript_30929/g.87600 Transcript_30929/m.87600 type:complete len:222 (+) Transcript_30929:275-940(+)|eukprot:CAMPEP_0117659688 /NCGR_PEP_ID=MMETSP0804-20121206/6565_1 /TAXON_ID=1074897 /ORGANISM="Tetraselmis astigmatica, Strain CCMP880" /LENGTH=221 /DNA_ID=CAMNT_0005466361 /DNA_START=542 /DNA_END=1207 /DNA_ORIENTATION=-
MRGVPFAVVGLQVGVAPCGVLEGLLQHPHRLGHVSSFPLGRQLVVKNGVRGCGHLLLHLRSAETFLGLLDAQPLHHCLVGRRAKASPNLLLHGQPLKEVLLLFEHHLAAAALQEVSAAARGWEADMRLRGGRTIGVQEPNSPGARAWCARIDTSILETPPTHPTTQQRGFRRAAGWVDNSGAQGMALEVCGGRKAVPEGCCGLPDEAAEATREAGIVRNAG